MKYVCSDIHGCYDKFIKMLDLINFTSQDTMYVLGDVLDRGDKPICLIDYIAAQDNIILIKGNHEEMFAEYFIDGDLTLWYMNGGNTTHEQIISNKDYLYEEQLYRYIKRLPVIQVVDKFILVHAGLHLPKNLDDLTIEELIELQEDDNCLWTRSNIEHERKFKDYTVIQGHTPTQTIIDDYKNPKILHREGNIYVDCGCCFDEANGKLACLRLDDMREFYI